MMVKVLMRFGDYGTAILALVECAIMVGPVPDPQKSDMQRRKTTNPTKNTSPLTKLWDSFYIC